MQRNLGLVFAILVFTGCASIVKEKADLHPVKLTETVQVAKVIELDLDTGYSKNIKANSTWSAVGDISQGRVYKPVDDVFSIEGTQQYEAYLVVQQGKVVGFYLPASSNYSPLTKHVSFP